MKEIRFDLGKKLEDTADRSGVPRFQTMNVDGLREFSVNQIPPGVQAHYVRAGYEVVVPQPWAFSLWSNNEFTAGNVDTAVIQIKKLYDHAQAKALIEGLVKQFQPGQWQRDFDPQCPRVTGRSTFLDEKGALESTLACPLDPEYPLSMEEWVKLFDTTRSYLWIGDGVRAELRVRYMVNSGVGLNYTIFVEFALADVKDAIMAQNQARALKERLDKGWSTPEKERSEAAQRHNRIKRLEAAAVARGDRVVQRIP